MKIRAASLLALTIVLILLFLLNSCDDRVKAVESPSSAIPDSAMAPSSAPRASIPEETSFPLPGAPVEGPTIYGDPITGPVEEIPSPSPSEEYPPEEIPSPSPTIVLETPEPSPGPSGPLAIEAPPEPDPVTGKRPWIDLVFVVDTTGSMGDEIEVIKNKIDRMVADISSGLPVPYVRYGIVAYRDRGDEFVTYSFDLTNDTAKVYRNISALSAGGGGDTEESVCEALSVAVNHLSWDKNNRSRKLIFLIGDAGPKRYIDEPTYSEICGIAGDKGIIIHSVGCSGILRNGKDEFSEIASSTGGIFDYLTYRQRCRTFDGNRIWLLVAGGKNIAVVNDSDVDRWKEGYREMIRLNLAKEPSADLLAGLVPEGEPENNLDFFLVEQVKKEAEKLGVRYKKR